MLNRIVSGHIGCLLVILLLLTVDLSGLLLVLVAAGLVQMNWTWVLFLGIISFLGLARLIMSMFGNE